MRLGKSLDDSLRNSLHNTSHSAFWDVMDMDRPAWMLLWDSLRISLSILLWDSLRDEEGE